MFATGVTVITTLAGEQVHGMTANAFMSVSLQAAADPDLGRPAGEDERRCCARARGTGSACSRSVRRRSPTASPAASPTMRRSRAFEIVHDTPLVEGALAHLVARVVRSYWGGDHSLFLGQVEYVRYGEGTPLLFHGGRYERVVRDPRVFSELPGDLLDPLIASGVERSFADGELLMERGEPGVTLYLLLEGTVRVERPGRLRAHERRRARRRDRDPRSQARGGSRTWRPKGRCARSPSRRTTSAPRWKLTRPRRGRFSACSRAGSATQPDGAASGLAGRDCRRVVNTAGQTPVLCQHCAKVSHAADPGEVVSREREARPARVCGSRTRPTSRGRRTRRATRSPRRR